MGHLPARLGLGRAVGGRAQQSATKPNGTPPTPRRDGVLWPNHRPTEVSPIETSAEYASCKRRLAGLLLRDPPWRASRRTRVELLGLLNGAMPWRRPDGITK